MCFLCKRKPDIAPAHNECVICGKHIPDNESACASCYKRAMKAQATFVNHRWYDDDVLKAIDIIEDGKRNDAARFMPSTEVEHDWPFIGNAINWGVVDG